MHTLLESFTRSWLWELAPCLAFSRSCVHLVDGSNREGAPGLANVSPLFVDQRDVPNLNRPSFAQWRRCRSQYPVGHRPKMACIQLDPHRPIALGGSQHRADARCRLCQQGRHTPMKETHRLVGPARHGQGKDHSVGGRFLHLDLEELVHARSGYGMKVHLRRHHGEHMGRTPADLPLTSALVSSLVDLRSDTVTRPTSEMRRAMASAEVGDDGYGEDPTVNELERTFAERVGKEAALFVPSGTMANQIALRALAKPGSLVIAGRRQHIVAYEQGAASLNAGIQFHLVDDSLGVVSPADVDWAHKAAHEHQPAPGMVCIENTHMASGGVAWTLDELESLTLASGDLPIHMDGARLFNAEVATGIAASDLAARATTVMTCLSKGLCCPVGSVLAGPAELMLRCRLERKRLGGAMRQAGVLAAAGLVALRTMVSRLAEDHERARRLSIAVAERWPEALPDADAVRTNIVVFPHPAAHSLIEELRSAGVLAGTIAPGVVRLMTHHDVDDAGIERALSALSSSTV